MVFRRKFDGKLWGMGMVVLIGWGWWFFWFLEGDTCLFLSDTAPHFLN